MALCYKPKVVGSKLDEVNVFFFSLSIYLILPAALGLGAYSASNRNEFSGKAQKQLYK
jgi:hypothetical protein